MVPGSYNPWVQLRRLSKWTSRVSRNFRGSQAATSKRYRNAKHQCCPAFFGHGGLCWIVQLR